MANSTHKVEVFRVKKLIKHPNADTLNIMTVFDNYQAVVRIADFAVGDLAAYVPPDSILPNLPEYAFLKGSLRIKASKLRGIMSQGLVLKAPPNTNIGDDVAALLGIVHYVPSAQRSGGCVARGAVRTDLLATAATHDADTACSNDAHVAAVKAGTQ